MTKKIKDLIELCKSCRIDEEIIFRTLQNNNSSKQIANQQARFIEEQARRREKSEFSPNRNVQMQLVLTRQKEEEIRARRQREEENRARRQRAQEKKMSIAQLRNAYDEGILSNNAFNRDMNRVLNYYGNND